jgi:hypothetical protein
LSQSWCWFSSREPRCPRRGPGFERHATRPAAGADRQHVDCPRRGAAIPGLRRSAAVSNPANRLAPDSPESRAASLHSDAASGADQLKVELGTLARTQAASDRVEALAFEASAAHVTLQNTLTMTDPESWDGEWTSTKYWYRDDSVDAEEAFCLPDINDNLLSTRESSQVR